MISYFWAGTKKASLCSSVPIFCRVVRNILIGQEREIRDDVSEMEVERVDDGLSSSGFVRSFLQKICIEFGRIEGFTNESDP